MVGFPGLPTIPSDPTIRLTSTRRKRSDHRTGLATRKAKFPFAHHVCHGGNAEVIALREFFAV